jgi:hypothetical protein
MKQHTITQEYTLTVTVSVEVPDDWADEDTLDYFSEFPINATVVDLWEHDEEPEVNVGALEVNALSPFGKNYLDTIPTFGIAREE